MMNKPYPMRQFEACVVVFMFLCAIVGIFGYVLPKISVYDDEILILESQVPVANDILITNKEYFCDSAYLGAYNVENYGILNLECENGRYFGNSGSDFTIAMVEGKQKGCFMVIMCDKSGCYSIPGRYENGVFSDGTTFNYFRMEKIDD